MRSDPPPIVRWLGALLLWLFAASAQAAPEALLDGELGDWIDDTVAPALGEVLSRHPRFDGETVRLVAVVPGAEAGTTHALAVALERRLRQRLLAVDGVRLAADTPRSSCEAPRSVDYLVRLEVAPAGGRDARVHVAVVDLAESVWVSGISHQWQGRLGAAERRAMQVPVVRTAPGTAASPIPVERAADVAAALESELSCLLPRDLDGALHVATPDDPALARIALALQGSLMVEPLAAVTPSRDAADWLLTLEPAPSRDGPRTLDLTLSAGDGSGRTRVASVYVTGLAGGAVADAVAPDAPVPVVDTSGPPALPARADLDLLSNLRVAPAARAGICDSRAARNNSCVEIDFDLHDRAYVFVLSTRDHRVADAPCALPEPDEPGPRRYRVRLPPGRYGVDVADTGPDAGFYVLATRSRPVAQRLSAALRDAPGQCASDRQDDGAWLAELRALLGRDAGDIAWRAVHLIHGRDGIAAL
ncbi:MAG: hypothetical protein CMQ43_11950 [Gammaproteobacteria bacterium]|nr:hypothetical protein [Gammaproteobacteria bacterium]